MKLWGWRDVKPLMSMFLPTLTVAESVRLTIASSYSTNLPWVGVMHTLVVPESNRRLQESNSRYRIRWREAYGGSLCLPDDVRNVLAGLGREYTDRVAEVINERYSKAMQGMRDEGATISIL